MPPVKTRPKGRKQMVSREDRGFSEIKRSGDPEKQKKTIIYVVSIALGIMFLFLSIMNMPFGPFSQVKEEYKDSYPSNEDDQRMYMKEGPLPVNITVNVTGMWIKDEISIGWHSFLLISIIFFIGPTSFYEVRRRKRIEKIEERLSDFL
ncbi:MAG: hypothetical protein ACMUHB_00085, partial [Thermoplasmatota archaeon]